MKSKPTHSIYVPVGVDEHGKAFWRYAGPAWLKIDQNGKKTYSGKLELVPTGDWDGAIRIIRNREEDKEPSPHG